VKKVFLIFANIILKREYVQATTTFRQFLGVYPESYLQEWAYFMLAESLFSQKEYAGAIQAYRRALEEKRQARLEDRVFSRLGYAYFFMKDYEGAIQSWERLLADYPNHKGKNEILYWLAEASLRKQDFRKCAAYVDRLKGDSVFYPKGLSSLGWYHFQKREWKEANHYFLKILNEFPEHQSTPSVSLMVAECFLNQNDYKQARAHLVRVTSQAKGNGDTEKALYLLGWIGYREENFDEAIDRFRMILDSYPSSLSGRISTGSHGPISERKIMTRRSGSFNASSNNIRGALLFRPLC
jgi:TolA-binding protein